MSLDHQPPPPSRQTDLGELATEAHHALMDKEAQLQAMQKRRLRPRWYGAGTIAALMIAFLAWYLQTHAPSPTQEQIERGRTAILSLVSSSLANHFRSFGKYPERLEDALSLPSDMEITYRRSGNGYILEIRGNDGHILTVRHG